MPQTTLHHDGCVMRWTPTRLVRLGEHGPLDADEPLTADIPALLADGFAVFVQLDPGDGTRYGLLLARGDDGITVMRTGAPCDGSVCVEPDRELTAEDCRPLAAMNSWSRTFFAWWLNELRAADVRR